MLVFVANVNNWLNSFLLFTFVNEKKGVKSGSVQISEIVENCVTSRGI